MDSRRHKKAGYPPSYEGDSRRHKKAGYPLHMKGATDTFSFKPTVITYNEANI